MKDYREKLAGRLRGNSYRAVVVLYPERNISRVFQMAGIPTRIGTIRRFQSIYFNRFIFHSRKSCDKHESEYNLDFLRFFIAGETISTPRVYIRDEEYMKGRGILEKAGVSGKYIILHPGSGGSADRWPIEKFIMLHKKLESDGYMTVFTGSAAEGDMIRAEAERAGVSIRNLSGQTELRELMAILGMAELVVANSTGPLHLAAATGTKVVGLYPSNKLMSPVRWGPRGAESRIIQPSPEAASMESIEVDRVTAAVNELLVRQTKQEQSR